MGIQMLYGAPFPSTRPLPIHPLAKEIQQDDLRRNQVEDLAQAMRANHHKEFSPERPLTPWERLGDPLKAIWRSCARTAIEVLKGST